MRTQISRAMYNKYRNSTPKIEIPKTASFEEIQSHIGLPWLRLEIGIPTETILQELEQIRPFLVDHRDGETEQWGWKSFCIHGKEWDATREDSYYNDHRGYKWTDPAVEHMPKTVQFFQKNWPAKTFYRVRVMLLEPGGYINIHQDYKNSEMTAINIAITQPEDCGFVMERQGCIPFKPGEAYWLDISNRHTVFNDSDKPRWHIIVHQDIWENSFKRVVEHSYKIVYNGYYENS